MPNVAFVHPKLAKKIPLYEETGDCVEGSYKVKYRRTKYLPMPNETDTSLENLARYDAYLRRAIFYNVTKATYSGLIGQIFAKPTELDIPSELEFLIKNSNGSGTGLEQLAKEGTGYVLKHGRFGILTDYPETDGNLSQTQIEEMNIRPSLKLYKSKNIVNWREIAIGSEVVLSMVTLKEKEVYYDDGFEFKEQDCYRVLKLNEEGNYQIDIYSGKGELYLVPKSSSIPTDFNGNPLKRIPFEFCGADNNDVDPDVPVLYDIAVLNLGHYINSAEYEDSCYMVGQPTPWFAGLTEEWVKGNPTIQLGSRGAIPLPENGSAGLLQPAPNTMPFEAMKHKEEQFLAIGAKLVTPNSSAKTATEATINNTTETSILSTVANNVSQAFENAIANCMQYVSSATDAKIIFKLNTDFEISKMSPAERTQLLNEWMKGGISWAEYRVNLKKGKIALEDDEKAKRDIEEEAVDVNPDEPESDGSSVGK